MWKIAVNREAGQVLVQVAILVGVLLAFLGLALDGGHFYAERRRMQNAADAGALAGARELCFGEPSEAVTAARQYAIDRNGAQWAKIDVDDWTVNVVASETMNTFFVGLIGIETADVQAEAAAICGGAKSAGGTWPLAFNYDVYSQSITCNQEFLVFSSKESASLECAGETCDCVEPSDPPTTTATVGCEEKCNCAALGEHILTADRGWLQMFDPGEAYPDDCKANTNCGASELQCWIRNDHPGPVAVGDCIPSEPGVSAAAKDDVDSRKDEILRIILWDRQCDYSAGSTDPEPLGECSGTPYRVAAFGCIEVIQWEQKVDVPQCGDPSKACKSGSNLKAVLVRKICDIDGQDADSTPPDPYDVYCASSSGSASGDPPDDLELRAVSLVK